MTEQPEPPRPSLKLSPKPGAPIKPSPGNSPQFNVTKSPFPQPPQDQAAASPSPTAGPSVGAPLPPPSPQAPTASPSAGAPLPPPSPQPQLQVLLPVPCPLHPCKPPLQVLLLMSFASSITTISILRTITISTNPWCTIQSAFLKTFSCTFTSEYRIACVTFNFPSLSSNSKSFSPFK